MECYFEAYSLWIRPFRDRDLLETVRRRLLKNQNFFFVWMSALQVTYPIFRMECVAGTVLLAKSVQVRLLVTRMEMEKEFQNNYA
jgi:hypothetical protein